MNKKICKICGVEKFYEYNIEGYVSENIYFIGKNNWFNRLKAKLIHKCKERNI